MACGLEHLIARRLLLVGELQSRDDRCLLLIRARRRRQRRRIGAAREDGARDRVHVCACARELRLRTRPDLFPGQRRVEREAQLRIVELRSETKVALRFGQQALLEPQLVLRHRRARPPDGGLQAAALVLREHAELRHDELIDQREHAGVLFDRGLRMNSRHARGVEHFAHLGQQPRQLAQALADVVQPLRQRREVARHQQIDTVARELGVNEGIPAPLAQLLDAPDLIFELARQQPRVDLMRSRQLGWIQCPQRGEQFSGQRHAPAVTGGAHIIERGIMTMVAERGGGDRRQLQHLVQIALRNTCELCVGGSRCHGRRGCRRGNERAPGQNGKGS